MKNRKNLATVIVLFGLILVALYTIVRFSLINTNTFLLFFSIILLLAELHTILHLYGFLYSIWPRKYINYRKSYINPYLRINIFICVCGEPVEIVRHTILSAKKAAEAYTKTIHPHIPPKVIVLNDGLTARKDNWQEIAQLAYELDIYHIARTTPGGFKAGNINNGLKNFPASNPHQTIDVVFDSDFAAKEEFLLEITKPFVDQKVDFVQTPQRYQNEESWVAKAAAAHQIYFFDHICPAKGKDNALFLCGTNFAIRREALDEVGGIDERFITEDYATSLNLHLKGKKGVFLSKVLALGIAPSTLKAYFGQQQRWSKGNFDVTSAYFKQLFFGNLTLKQKLHYMLSATYYLIGIRDLIFILAPLPYLYSGISLVQSNTFWFLFLIYTPYLFYNLLLYIYHFKHPFKSLVLDVVSFPVFTASFLSSILKKNLGFIVTIKKYEKDNLLRVYRVQLMALVALSTGLLYSIYFRQNWSVGAFFNYFWATYDVLFLTLGFYLIARENYNMYFIEESAKKAFPLLIDLFISLPKLLFKPALAAIIVILVTNQTTLISLSSKTTKGLKLADFRMASEYLDSANKQNLLIPSKGVYYGYYNPSLDLHPQEPKIGVVLGEKPSLVMFYQEWDDEVNFNTDFIEKLSENNIIPVVTWEPWDPKNDLPDQTKYTPQLIIQGNYDSYIKGYAQKAAEYKKPFFLRFAHEMNGNWYPWGNVNNNTPEDYKKMWIHVYNIFKEAGATNVIWVWAPNNTDEYGEIESIPDYYPGDKYVDWVGFSGFNWGTSSRVSSWRSFKQLSFSTYQILLQFDKPIMVGETSSASAGGNKALWFEQTLQKDIPSMEEIKAVIFFDADNRGADFSFSKNMNEDLVVTQNIINNQYYLKTPSYISAFSLY